MVNATRVERRAPTTKRGAFATAALLAMTTAALVACGGSGEEASPPVEPNPPVTPAVVGLMAGSETERGYVDGPALQARFGDFFTFLSYRPNGELLILDNHSVRQLTLTGDVVTLAGDGQAGFADGQGHAARFNRPQSAVVAPDGNVYVADAENHLVRKLSPDGTVTTFAGQPGICGNTDGLGTAATLCQPTSLALDGSGNLYVSEETRHSTLRAINGWAFERSSANPIRKITPTGLVSTFVAKASEYPSNFTVVSGATVAYLPVRLAANAQGAVDAADPNDHVIRRYLPDGTSAVFSGVVTGAQGDGFSFATNRGVVDGSATEAKFQMGGPFTKGADGAYYLMSSRSPGDEALVIRRVQDDGSVSTVMTVPGCESNGCGGAGLTRDASGAFVVAVRRPSNATGIYRYP